VTTTGTTRTWAGSTLAERQAVRRAQLIAAGRDLLGSGTPVTVRAVCRAAKLTERYFYESFRDRDELVIAAFEAAAHEAVAAIVEAVAETDGRPESIARAGVRVAVEQTIDDPRRGHVLVVAPVSDPVLFAKRDEMLPVLTALFEEHIDSDAGDGELVASALAGALVHLFFRYLTGELRVERRRFEEHCVRLLLAGGAGWRLPAHTPDVSTGEGARH
jgi:AcrR family transcriptional regulator